MIAIVLSRPKSCSPISWAIRKITNSDVSHASIHFSHIGGPFSTGYRWVLESTGSGVNLVAAERWDNHNKLMYAFRIRDDVMGPKALYIIFRELGAEYDFAGIGRFCAYLVLEKVNKRLARMCVPDTPDKMFCSEVVARYLHLLDGMLRNDSFEPVKNLLPDLTSPEDLKMLRLCEGATPCAL